MPVQGRGPGEQTSIQNLEQTVVTIAVTTRGLGQDAQLAVPSQQPVQHNTVSRATPHQQNQERNEQREADEESVNMETLQVALSERVTAFHALHKDILNKHMEQLVHKAVDQVGGMASSSKIDQNNKRFLDTVYHTAKKNKANSRTSTPFSQVMLDPQQDNIGWLPPGSILTSTEPATPQDELRPGATLANNYHKPSVAFAEEHLQMGEIISPSQYSQQSGEPMEEPYHGGYEDSIQGQNLRYDSRGMSIPPQWVPIWGRQFSLPPPDQSPIS
ncbi:hypothetical protein BDQ17DRAFT_1323978 [Cyathus striatus]|nr:hypothetical protein BDQ17DRAFT_1323978 [Cyathus striatus]